MRLIDEEEMRATYGTVAEILEGERLMEERKRRRLEEALESLSKLSVWGITRGRGRDASRFCGSTPQVPLFKERSDYDT